MADGRISPTDEPEAPPPPLDPALAAPLAPLGGAEPPMPDWARAAIDTPHERGFVEVAGAAIEWIAWGPAGSPGLLLLHGNGAHADWWRFTAPLLAEGGLRVAAVSWSGMGNSDHRPRYSLDLFLAEALAAAETAGLGPCFAVAGHSFGGVPAVGLARRHADRVRRAIVIDTPFGEMRRPRPARDQRPPRGHRIYPTRTEALASFRWAPMQPSPNLWAADFIARTSLKAVDSGFSWKFDPFLWQNFRFDDPSGLLSGGGAPLDYVWGEQSLLVEAGVVARIRALMPPGTRFVGIPDAHHHVIADQPIALVTALRALLA
jgi:pimeloyl-ACP methyl ester carboxylesterase